MANMVKSTDYNKNQKQILIGQDSFFIALPAVITGSANTELKAGQPLAGDIEDRQTGFTKQDSGAAVGILLHDVKFDGDGNANGTILLAGCVDLLKLEEGMDAKIKACTGLDRIIFVKGSAY